MFLKFDEEDSFVPAIIFFYLFFWLGGIVCSLCFLSWFPERSGGHYFIVNLLIYGFGDALGFTFITALFYLIRLNKFAITFLPEGFIFGAYIMAYYYAWDLNFFNVKDFITRDEVEDFVDIVFVVIIPVCFLIIQGLCIKRKRHRNKNFPSKKRLQKYR